MIDGVKTLLGFWSSLPVALEFIILVATAIGAVFTIKKFVYSPIKRHFDKVNRGMDTLVGYPAVVDPGTGRVIQEATPPLALRVYDLELNSAKVSDALVTIAENQKQIVEIQAVMDERKAAGEKVIQEWTQWRMQHEDEAKQREQNIAEWNAWRQEQTILMESILNAHESPHQ